MGSVCQYAVWSIGEHRAGQEVTLELRYDMPALIHLCGYVEDYLTSTIDHPNEIIESSVLFP